MPSVWTESRQNKHGRSWVVRWEVVQDGRRVRGSEMCGPSKAHAEQFRAKKLDELFAGKLGLPVAGPRTWKAASEIYLSHCQNHKAEKTFLNFDRRTIDQFTAFVDGSRSIRSIGTEDILAFEKHLAADGYAANTIRIRLRTVRTAFNYFRREGWIARTPTFHFPKEVDVERIIPPKELKDILARLSPAFRPGVILLLHTGCRLQEMMGLDGCDLQGGADSWEVKFRTAKRKQGEQEKHRLVPIPAALAETLRLPVSTGRVFTSFTRNSIQAAFRDAVRALKLPRTRIHDLRHTWATRYMEETGDLYGLMRLGGWKDIKSVLKYQHLTRGRSLANLKLDFGVLPNISPKKE